MKSLIGLAFGALSLAASALGQAQGPPAAQARNPPATQAQGAPAAQALGAPASPVNRRGERLFLQCRACHALGTDQEGKIGPPLHGMVDRKAGAVPGFGYSKALVGADITWDEATLDRWLAQPSAVAPGTSMVFAGVPKPDDRRELIAYLKRATAP